eukprot:15454118-Alexandrium_andersonii.AAC.1
MVGMSSCERLEQCCMFGTSSSERLPFGVDAGGYSPSGRAGTAASSVSVRGQLATWGQRSTERA